MSSKLVANQALMKQQNQARVVYALWKNSPISRTGLAKFTGLNKATITNIILSLQEENMVVHKGSLQGSVGRAQKLLMFNENYGLCAGIMIRAKNINLAISNVRAKILWSSDVPFSAEESPLDVVDRVASTLEEGLAACKQYSENFLGIAVGTASLLRHEDDMLYAIHSIDWHNVPVIQYLRQRFHVPIIADTASNCAALGEKYFGIAENVSDMLYLSVGYGIGGGLFLGGKLYRGKEGFAGDIGHMTLDPNGPQCPCGKRGCWEMMASAIPTGKSFLELGQAADEGDGTAIAELAKIGNNLGKGLANLINVLNPQLIVLGGDVVHAGKWVMTPCRSTLQERVWPWVWERTRVEYSGLSSELGVSTPSIIGAITKVIELLFQ